MKTAVVIPARLGATRLPRKPLRDLAGEPLIVRVWRRVHKMGIADRVVVATDHEDVARIARAAGADVAMTSSECSSGTARVAEVARLPEFKAFDAFVNVQGDEPFISSGFISAAADIVRSGRFTLGTAAATASDEIFDRPSIVKVVTAVDGRALYFSRAPIPFLRESTDAELRRPLTLQHIGVYSYTREALARWMTLPPHPLEDIERLEQLRPLAHGMDIGVAIVNERAEAGIDTEEDLQAANDRWSSFEAGER
ncbi:MAG: 3-deoxy-manno-octulosonate cytidylyltransferase [Gemmatimonadaceae bacterium]